MFQKRKRPLLHEVFITLLLSIVKMDKIKDQEQRMEKFLELKFREQPIPS